jgi:hypothetical protein
MIVICCSPSGSGKTRLAQNLTNTFAAIKVFEDVDPRTLHEIDHSVRFNAINIGFVLVNLESSSFVPFDKLPLAAKEIIRAWAEHHPVHFLMSVYPFFLT